MVCTKEVGNAEMRLPGEQNLICYLQLHVDTGQQKLLVVLQWASWFGVPSDKSVWGAFRYERLGFNEST